MKLSNFINELKHNSMPICIEIINLETQQKDQYIGTVGQFKTSIFKEDYYDEEINMILFTKDEKNKESIYISCLQ